MSQGTKRALLVGIGEYPLLEELKIARSLGGTLNDVAAIHEVLLEYGFLPENIEILSDDGPTLPTRDNILGAMDRLAEAVESERREREATGQEVVEDIVAFFYAGHGSKLRADHLWPGQVFQTLVPRDSGRPSLDGSRSLPNRDILDTEIGLWIERLNAFTSNVTLIFDSCHSGGISSATRGRGGDGSAEARSVPADQRPLEQVVGEQLVAETESSRRLGSVTDLRSTIRQGRQTRGDEPAPEGRSGFTRRPDRSAVVLTACTAKQVATESTVEGTLHGRFTAHLVRALAGASGKRWKEIFDPGETARFQSVAGGVKKEFDHQSPCREGDGPIFAVAAEGEIDPEDSFPKAPTELEKFVAVIGIDRYGDAPVGAPFDSLGTAVRDAERVASVLQEKQGYTLLGVKRSNAKPLVDEEATGAAIRKLIRRVASEVKFRPDSAVVLYFAGHGEVESDGEGGFTGYLIPWDADRNDPERKSWIPMTELRALLAGEEDGSFQGRSEGMACRHLLLVLDCCFAGAMTFGWFRGEAEMRRPIFESEYRRFLQGRAWHLMTSASFNERALDRDPNNLEELHSPFASALIDGLETRAADSSREGSGVDHIVTVTELHQLVGQRLSRLGGQRPGLMPLSLGNTGQFVFRDPEHDGEPTPMPDPPLDPSQNPWRGPEPYADPAGTELFFGRQRAVVDLLGRLVDESATMLVVTGPSGVGKTSLLQAGLLPLLQETGAGLAKVQSWISGLEMKHLSATTAELEEIRKFFDLPRLKEVMDSPPELAQRTKERLLELGLFAVGADGAELDAARVAVGATGLGDMLPSDHQRRLRTWPHRLGLIELLEVPEELADRVRLWTTPGLPDLLDDPGALEAMGRWTLVELDPDNDPDQSLAEARRVVDAVSPERPTPVLILLDQAEKLYAPDRGVEGRRRLLAGLEQFEKSPAPVQIIVSIRSGFLATLRSEVGNRLDEYRVPRPRLDELQEVIEGPAGSRAVFLSPRLMSALIDRAVVAPAPLALLSNCLHAMYLGAWDRRGNGDRELNRQDYNEAGGLDGAAVRALDELLAEDPSSEPLLRRVFLRMVGEDSDRGRRSRHARWEEFEVVDADEQRQLGDLLQRLVDRRVLVRGDSTLQLASDGLLGWERLNAWLKARVRVAINRWVSVAANLPLLRSLGRSALEWKVAEHSPSLLWDDPERLELLLVLRDELNRLEQWFVDTSEAVRRAERSRETVTAGWTRAIDSLIEAAELARRGGGLGLADAESALRRLLAASPISRPLPLPEGRLDDLRGLYFSDDGLEVCCLTSDGTWAWRIEDPASAPRRLEEEHHLGQGFGWAPGALFELENGKEADSLEDVRALRVAGPSLPPDGDARLWAHAASLDGSIWLCGNGRSRKLLGHRSDPAWFAFHPTGRWLASAGLGEAIRLWRVQSPELLELGSEPTTFYASRALGRYRSQAAEQEKSRLVALAFDGDDCLLAVRDNQPPLVWELGASSYPIEADERGIAPGELGRGAWLPGDSKSTEGGWFDPERVSASSYDGSWNAYATHYGALLLENDEKNLSLSLLDDYALINALAFDPVSGALATGGIDGRVLLWRPPFFDRMLPVELPTALPGMRVQALAFSADGRRLAAAMTDNLEPDNDRIVLFRMVLDDVVDIARQAVSYTAEIGLLADRRIV